MTTYRVAPAAANAGLLTLMVALLASSGCRSRPKPALLPDAGAVVYPRYWLVNTPVLDRPGGKPVSTVAGPVLVELLPKGLVRTVAADGKQLEGYLPEELLREPGARRGLMLYAQQESELRWRGPHGPIMGRLHPGAFVSVVPEAEDHVRVGSLPFKSASDHREGSQLVLYTTRRGLGVDPGKPVECRRQRVPRRRVLHS